MPPNTVNSFLRLPLDLYIYIYICYYIIVRWLEIRWLDSITHSVDMNSSKLQEIMEIMENRDALCAVVHGVTER